MRNTLGAVLLLTLVGTVLPGTLSAATIVPFSGQGNVSAGPCSPDQTDPTACFTLSDTTDLYTVGGASGYRFELNGVLVPNPEPDAFPFPTYVGTGTFALSRAGDSLFGTWQNVFFPAPPPADCDAMAPFGDPDCWAAESSASFEYVVSGGTGIYAGLLGTGTSQVEVVTGFPPGNVNPAVGSPYAENGAFALQAVPEPTVVGLLVIGLLGRAFTRRAHR